MKENQLVSEYLTTDIKGKKRPVSTVVTYKSCIDFYLEHVGKELDNITKHDVELYVNHLNQSYKETTQKKNIVVLKSFYEFLNKKGYENLFSDVLIPVLPEVIYVDPLELPSPTELKLLLEEAAKSQRNYCIVILILVCRFTPLEITNFKWGDLGISDSGNIGANVLSRSIQFRMIPISKEIYVELVKYRLSLGKSEIIQESEYQDKVFTKITNLRNLIYGICSRAGIKKISAMDLAHTEVLLGIFGGATLSQAQVQAGFKDKTTLRKYSRYIPELQNPMCELIKIQKLLKEEGE